MHKTIILSITVTVIALAGFLSHDALASTVSSESLSSFHLFFKDLYSSSVGWIQIGTQLTVNDPSFSGIVKFNDVTGGGGISETRVVKQFPSTLQSNYWHAKFDYNFTASNNPAFVIFALTPKNIDPQSQKNSSQIVVEHGNGVNSLFIEKYPAGIDSAGIPISPNTQYYAEIVRMPQELKLFVFSDSARTINIPGSPVTLHIAQTDFKNLNFIQHDGCRDCGDGRSLTAQVDNTIIYSK